MPARASDRTYERLRTEILEWDLAPGTPLGEVELAARLGVSRTPLREALSRLVADGLAEPLGARGVTVSAMSIDDVRELFELRLALEQRAARLAAARRDRTVFDALLAELDRSRDVSDESAYYDLVRRMDEAIDAAIGNRYLAGALRALRVHLARVRRLAKDDPGRLVLAAGEHRVILRAIADGDGELAANAVHVHLHTSLESVLERIERAPAIRAIREIS